MKFLTIVGLLLVTGSTLHAASLGEAAKRERERREKNKAAGVEVKVISTEDLAAPSSGKGTYNDGTSGGSSSPSSTSSSSSFSDRGGSLSAPSDSPSSGALVPPGSSSSSSSDSDPKRDAARRRLAASYQRIAQAAAMFLQYAEAYHGCPIEAAPGTRCYALRVNAASWAIKVAKEMDQAEDDARRGSLPAGEVRRIREAYGLDDPYWDKLVRYMQQHRH
jgi:hypothetical protein